MLPSQSFLLIYLLQIKFACLVYKLILWFNFKENYTPLLRNQDRQRYKQTRAPQLPFSWAWKGDRGDSRRLLSQTVMVGDFCLSYRTVRKCSRDLRGTHQGLLPFFCGALGISRSGFSKALPKSHSIAEEGNVYLPRIVLVGSYCSHLLSSLPPSTFKSGTL